MTVEEIFKRLANNMLKGVMIHEELAEYYNFLNLCGYKKCHQYHYLEETNGYRKLNNYYITKFGKLINTESTEGQSVAPRQRIIPTSWYQHVKADVDTKTKRQAVESGVKAWINWEQQAHQFYTQAYRELIELGEAGAAMFLSDYVCDVEKELKCAKKKHLDLKSCDFSINYILDQQEIEHKKYKKKIKKIKLC